MTVFNGGPYLQPAVSSLLNQTFGNFELLVLNNGSTDNSLNVLKSFHDSRLRVVSLDKTIPRTEALNTILSEARSEFVAVQDADDLSLPGRLKKQMDYITRDPQVALLGTWVEFISENGTSERFFRPPESSDEIVGISCRYNPFVHSSVMYKRSLVNELGAYPPQFVYAQDFALWLKFIKLYRVAILPEVLVKVRMHSGQMGGAPEQALLRAREILELMELAAANSHAKTRGEKPGVVEARFDYAMALWNVGQYRQAVPCFARSCLRYPHLWMLDRDMRRSLLLKLIGHRSARWIKKSLGFLRGSSPG